MERLTFPKSKDNQYQYKVDAGPTEALMRNLVTSETHPTKSNAKRGFYDDLSPAVFSIVFSDGKFIETCEKAGILDKVRELMATVDVKPEGVVDFIGTRPPERPPRKPGEADVLTP